MFKLKNLLDFWEKNYVLSIILAVLLLIFYFLGIKTNFLQSSILNYSHIKSDPFDWTVYPIDYVPNPLLLTREQRNVKFDEIDINDFIKLPIYDINIISRNPEELIIWSPEYIETIVSRITYTVLYMWNYNFDYKEYVWSHPSIDIVAPEWTPIRNIANWVVVKTWFQPWWFGNYIVVRHDNVPLQNWEIKTIYSSYSHLENIWVKQWEKVSKWDIIWTVWNTWISTSSHVDFQIALEDAPNLPYWPFSLAEARSKWLGFFSGVNEW